MSHASRRESNVTVSDSATDRLNHLKDTFGHQQFDAAERLVESGSVEDVRILQAGSVVTGVVGVDRLADPRATKHRVYIQYQTGRGEQARFNIVGECSCGQRSACVHVAAVLIASLKDAGKTSPENQGGSTGPSPAQTRQPPPSPSLRGPVHESARVSARDSTVLQQRLFYLLEASGGEASSRTSATHIMLSIWVGSTSAHGGRVDVNSACPFVLRPSDRNSEYPRYVDPHDKAIIRTLTAQHLEAPWSLRDESGVELLRQCVSTGRAFWRSLSGNPLRPGSARHVTFGWKILPNGDQQLLGEMPGSFEVILAAEPPVYVDCAVNECGEAHPSVSSSVLRHYLDRSPISPEQVAAVNEELAGNAAAVTFPRLQTIVVQRQTLTSLHARLVLSAGPEATLYFLYNDLAVDSRSMRADQDTVRKMHSQAYNNLSGDPGPGGIPGSEVHESTARIHAQDNIPNLAGAGVVCELDRDRSVEQRLQTQLDHALPVDARQNPEKWLAFMMSSIPELKADGWIVHVEPDFPYRIATLDSWYAHLQTNPAQLALSGPKPRDRPREWFDLRLGVMVEGQSVNLLPALVSYLQGASPEDKNPSYRIGDQLLIPLDDGRYLPVAIDRIQCIADTLVELFDREDGLNDRHALSLPRSQASRLAQLSLDLNSVALRSNDGAMLDFVQQLREFSGIQPLPAPERFHATLRPYQQEGLGWLQFLRRFHLGGILADDMGLGKTVQTLAHLALEKQQGRLTKPSLIVAPVSVIGNWRQEIQRFTPELKLLTLHGAQRKELFPAIDAADVVVIGYPSLQLDGEVLLAREFSFLIFDEAQMIKNPRAKVSQVARALRAEHRLCLTGTPMENHLGELWSLFDFLQPGFLGDEKQFQRQYRTPIEKNADRSRSTALARRVAPFVLRRTKDAVAKDLPEKTQIVESLVLDERQRDFYDGIRLAMHRRVREVIQQQGLARSQITVLDALLKLRQACCDPRLALDDAETRTIPSAKMDWLRTVLPELVEEGRRILLFSQFTSMLRLIEAVVKELAIPYLMLTGETQRRADLVARFQAGAAPLFLISLKAGGTGLNLTAADTVIHYDPWWNPAAEAQATDRAHRIGQDKPVFVYKLIAQGTVEEKIMQLQADKHALAAQLFGEHNASPARLSATDLEGLFAP